jgi:hypothetical protein
MRRGGRFWLLLVLPDGTRALIPAAWTDVQTPDGSESGEGTLGRLEDLLAARRVLEPLLERVVLGERDDGRARRTVLQLRLDLAECPAPATALWELLGEQERGAVMALLAAVIALLATVIARAVVSEVVEDE